MSYKIEFRKSIYNIVVRDNILCYLTNKTVTYQYTFLGYLTECYFDKCNSQNVIFEKASHSEKQFSNRKFLWKLNFSISQIIR